MHNDLTISQATLILGTAINLWGLAAWLYWREFKKEQRKTMADQVQEVKDAITALGTKFSDDLTAVNTSLTAELTAVGAKIAALIAAGQATPEDLQPVLDQVTALSGTVDTSLTTLKTAIDAETAALSAPPADTGGAAASGT